MAIAATGMEAAATNHDQTLWTDQQWRQIKDQVELLDRIAYFPGLLPVIMLHRDSIGLTNEQLRLFRQWKRRNYSEMVGLMNEIIRLRLMFSRDALDVGVSNSELLQSQNRLFALQARLLGIRLSCRKVVFDTFTAEQWGNLAFVLEDYPTFAGILGSATGGAQE